MASETLQVILQLITGQYKKEARDAAMATGQIGDAAATAGSATDRMGGRMARTGGIIKVAFAAAAAGAIANVIGDLDELGQRMEANERMADTVFGEMAADARTWADANNEAFGIGENKMLGLLSATQDLLVPMGFMRDVAFDMSKEILNTANALSEWKGGSITAEDAQLRLAKAILGETEGLVELGVKISQADIQTRLAQKGQKELTGTALAQAKAQATLELVMERSTDALAAYTGRAGSAVAAQKELEASTADTAETWADIFRPAIDAGKEIISDIATIAGSASDRMRDLDRDSGDAVHTLGEFDILNTILPGFLDLKLILSELADGTETYFKHAEKVPRITQEEAAAIRDELVPAAVGAIEPLDRLTTAQRLAGDATRHHYDELVRLGDFLAGKINPILAARDAIIALADAQKIAEDAARDHGRESEEFALAQIEVALKTAEAEAALATFGANAPAAIDAVAQTLGISDEAARDLFVTLGLLRDGDWTITTTIVSRQVNLIEQGVIPEGQGIPGGQGITVRGPWSPQEIGQIDERQHGGPVTAGRPYMVGERGPEMMVPNQSGTILPNGWNRPNSTIVIQSPMNDFAQDLQLATILATVNTMVEVQN